MDEKEAIRAAAFSASPGGSAVSSALAGIDVVISETT